MRKQNKRAAKQAPVKREAFTLNRIAPKTNAQRAMIESYQDGMNVVAYGSAGTGKSFIACYLALKDLLEKEKDRIIIVRSAVPTRDQGFLPGTLEEKSSVYQAPYANIINEICQNGTAWEILRKKDQVQFMTTSYIRGITLDNAVIIVDEFQNTNQQELYSVLTRVGENTQVILCGDTKQNDLNGKREASAFGWLMKVSERMPEWFELVKFGSDDIIRSEFVRELIKADEAV